MDIKKKNLEFVRRHFPGVKAAVAAARLAAVEWPVWLKPKVCEVTLTSRCNYRCLFCYNPPEFFSSPEPAQEPDFKAVCRALYEGRERGCWIAALIGGEPTLRPDIGRIAAFARKLGYACVKVCTNGSRLADKGFAAELAAAGVNMFDISLHGHEARVHDALVGAPGAFKAALKGAGNVRALGKEVGTNQVINRLNYRGFPAFFRLALLDLGINYFNIIYSHYRGVMAGNAGRLRVPVSKTVPCVKKALALLERSGLPVLSRPLVNFPPCLLPGYGAITADWEIEGRREPLLRADGSLADMEEMKLGQNRKPAACRRCAMYRRCRGIDAEYLELYGGAEFKPLKKEPPPVPLPVVFAAGGGK